MCLRYGLGDFSVDVLAVSADPERICRNLAVNQIGQNYF